MIKKLGNDVKFSINLVSKKNALFYKGDEASNEPNP